MSIAAIFRGDRFRLVSGSHCQTSENARHFRHKSCSDRRKGQADSLRPAIIARPCNDRVATQDAEQMDITSLLRSDRCTVVLPKTSKFPENSSKRSRTRKKSRIRTPSGAKSLAKRRFSAAKTGPDAPIKAQRARVSSRRRDSDRDVGSAGLKGNSSSTDFRGAHLIAVARHQKRFELLRCQSRPGKIGPPSPGSGNHP
jgi:hypothetical protein